MRNLQKILFFRSPNIHAHILIWPPPGAHRYSQKIFFSPYFKEKPVFLPVFLRLHLRQCQELQLQRRERVTPGQPGPGDMRQVHDILGNLLAKNFIPGTFQTREVFL